MSQEDQLATERERNMKWGQDAACVVDWDQEPESADEIGTFPHAPGAPLRRAIGRARHWLLGQQHPEGYWVGELEGDTILESEYILLLAFLGQENSPRAFKAARYLVEKQREVGGWSLYPGGDLDVSVSVKAYFALKLTGHDPSAEYMQRARGAILAAGGADRVNSFTRFYLALLGQISYECCPEVPPEAVLLPAWLPVNLYRVSAWSRTIIVPLSIMSAYRPVRPIEPARGIRDLFIRSPEEWPPLRCPGKPQPHGLLNWDRFFRLLDQGFKFCRRWKLLPLRRRAIAATERWMLERFAGSDGLGAIFPPIVWSIIALRALGYRDDAPEVQECHRQLDALAIEEEDTLRIQPCQSPVWDTAITLRSLAASGCESGHEVVQRGVDWLLKKEVRRAGDWAVTVQAEPGGWCFEYNNEFYPDLDDTAMVLMALRHQFQPEDAATSALNELPPTLSVVAAGRAENSQQARRQAIQIDELASASQRAIRWMLAMQNTDGGWGAFDANNNCEFLCHVPFADHNAMIDPSTPDLAARVLESLGAWGYRVGHPSVDRGVAYLRQTQQADGSWFGRWGVNYIYGTWQAITGLIAVGVATDDPAVQAGVHWLKAYQQASGGWGESADSYADPTRRGQGPTTASQTAWALLGLLAGGAAKDPAVERGVQYLLETQNEAGVWDETEFTGTGFPQVFYLRYHLYPVYFPLLALAQAAQQHAAQLVPAPRSKRPLVVPRLRVVGE